MSTTQEQQGGAGYLADTHTGLPIPGSDTFASFDEERVSRKRQLAATLRLFGRYGFGEGVSGHVSVRDPEYPELFWVNPFGVSFRLVRVSDLICVDESGTVIEGARPVNPSAFVIHSAIHTMRADAEAAAHAHTTHSRALAAVGRSLEPLDQESASFYGEQVLYDDYRGPSIQREQGRDIADKLAGARAALLRHHGLITVGRTLAEAVHRFVTYDGCAQVQLLAMAAGELIPMTEEQALAARDGFGDAELARFSFELLYEEITSAEPDLLG